MVRSFFLITRFAHRSGAKLGNPGVGLRLIPVNGSESRKKHDKQLTFIVRVRWS